MFRIFTFLALVFLIYQPTSAQIQEPPRVSKESEIDATTYTGIISEQYANGSPYLWKNKVNGKTEGLWLEWYPSGVLRYRAYWKNNLGHGRWEYYYPNGQLRSESFYINDIAQGIYKSYHQNGQLQMEATYLDGEKEGVQYEYDSNGGQLSRKLFENGTQVIDEPLVFELGIISVKNGNEWGINFMPDGKTAYFTRRDMVSGRKRIYTCELSENGWSIPKVASFSTGEDEAVFVNKDGTKLYFSSYRPLPNGETTQKMDMNIWFTELEDDKWSEPKPLSSSINNSMAEGNVWPANYEAGPIIDKEGNLYFWTKGSTNNGTNLYYAAAKKNGEYGKPKELLPPSLHTNYDSAPQLSPDGNVLFFSSDDRYDGYGGSDIYYAVKKDGKWSEAKNLGPVVNSYQSDGFPSFSPDGKYFYFSSNRAGIKDENGESLYDLYFMETQFLIIEK